jgi:hypothetical protein
MQEGEYTQADREVIGNTKNWIMQVVIGCNFCPFAAREMMKDSVHFRVERSVLATDCLRALQEECERLDEDEGIETTILILPGAFPDFNDYWGLVSMADKMLRKMGYEGVYQVASFHPLYLFAQTRPDDAANYTNRSVYPMLHLLREKGIWNALSQYGDPHKITERNLRFTREKGEDFMKKLRAACIAPNRYQ